MNYKFMKGITPVIAIILLLMITISLVGFTFVWFQRITSSAMNSTQQNLQNQQKQIGTILSIDNIDKTNGKVYVRNSGSFTVDTDSIAVYVNDTEMITCTWSGTSIEPGKVASCTNSTIKSCGTVKVTSGGSTDMKSC